MLGVKLDRTGIEVFVVNVLEGVRDGVRRPREAESERSESAVDAVRDLLDRSKVDDCGSFMRLY